MAPRNAKSQKEAKVAENEAPKKGRGKAKKIEEVVKNVEVIEHEKAEVENGDVAELVEKKKRGKKPQENGDLNGDVPVAPPAKRGRKKNAEPSVDAYAAEPPMVTPPEEPDTAPVLQVYEETPTNGNSDAKATDGADTSDEDMKQMEDVQETKSKKKPVKKEEKVKESKNKKDKENEVEGKGEEKPKGKGKARKAQPKAETETEPEDVKAEPAKPKRGRGNATKDKNVDDQVEEKKEKPKKGGGKAAKENVQENKDVDEENVAANSISSAKEMSPESALDGDEEYQVEEKSKKAPAKSRGKGKKVIDDGNEEAEVKEPASKKRKVNKKDKGQGDGIEDAEEEAPEPKAAKVKRGHKKVGEAPEPAAEPEDTGEGTKRRRKPVEEKAPAKDAKQKAPPKNKSTTNYEEIDFTNTSKSSQGKQWNYKIASWNVDGIRAWLSKGGLDYLQHEKPDILCLQEVKCSQDKMPDECKNVPGYHAYWLCSDKDGYAGVGIYTTKLAMNVQYGLQNEELDEEGRIITAEYEQFYLICTYVPNAGRKLVTLPKRLSWNDAFRNHVKELDKKKPVIICGDMNVAHNEIDLANPKTNRKNAGFTNEERSGMTDLLGDGFVDTYRHLYPDNTGAYTFWTYMMGARAKNTGWRLDYFIVSERLVPAVCDNVIRNQVFGSDHCPLALFLHLTTADKPKE